MKSPTAPLDSIVVGAGSAGAALAARLSEEPDRRVLLIEAGPDDAGAEEVPAELTARVTSDASIEHAWDFTAEPVPGREVDYPVGKVAGGSSAINSAVALRGAPGDYDEWAAAGCDGWSWEEVLPYFRRLESDRAFDSLWHGKDGPMPIARRSRNELLHVHRALYEAAIDLGHAEAPDLNAPDAVGVGPWPMNVRDGVRISTAAAYLTPTVRERPNLEIQSRATVRRVCIESGRAVGVELKNGKCIPAAEVTLCAGAISTPGILLRSGVGAADRVRAAGGELRVERAGVGENLMDHAFVWLCAVPTAGVCDLDTRSVEAGLRYTATGSTEQGDMQLLVVIPVDLAPTPALAKRVGVTTVFMIGAGLQRPRSRGRVTWADVGSPRIELNVLGHPADAARLREGIRLAWRVAGSAQMRPHVKRIALIDETTLEDDAALDAYIEAVVMTFKHAAGTARMGPAADPLAVVGADGIVHEVDGLRVADMSIVPNVPRANTNLTAIMIGERIADLIRAEPVQGAIA